MATRTISSSPYTVSAYIGRLARYGYLVRVLAGRELKVKYSRTILGIGWFFLQPVAVVVVYSIFFRYLIHINSDGIPYPAFVFSGLVMWYLFTGVIGKGTYALIESTDLIHKVPFPRLIVFISKVVPAVLECAVLMFLLFAVIIITGQPFGLNLLTSFFYFIEVAMFSAAIGLLCSLAAIKYRDIAHVIPITMNFAIWLTPVFFPLSIVPAPYNQFLLILNPVASAIEGMRGGVFHNKGIEASSIAIFAVSCIFLLVAFYCFVKAEKRITENL